MNLECFPKGRHGTGCGPLGGDRSLKRCDPVRGLWIIGAMILLLAPLFPCQAVSGFVPSCPSTIMCCLFRLKISRPTDQELELPTL